MTQNKSLTVPPNYLSKRGLTVYAQELAEDSIDGFIDPLRQFIQLTAIKKVVDQTLQMIKPFAIDEAEKFEVWDRVWGGVQFQIRQGPLKLDYSGDTTWGELNAKKETLEQELKKIKDALKERERFLKSKYLDLETGELGIDLEFVSAGSPTLAILFKDE